MKHLIELLGDAFLISYGLWIIIAFTVGAMYEPDITMKIFEICLATIISAVGVERLIDDLRR